MRRLHRPVLAARGAYQPAPGKGVVCLDIFAQGGRKRRLAMRALIVAGSRVQHGRGPYARRARYQGQSDQCNPRGRGQR